MKIRTCLKGITLLLVMTFLSGCRDDRPAGPNLLCVTMDTTRYDLVTPAVTPALWEVRGESTWFYSCMAPAPITLPSHSTLFTGLYPNRHGVRDNTIFRLDDRAVTLAERLGERGYHTAAFVSTFILDHRYGLDQGFMRYNDHFLSPKKGHQRLPVDRRAEETIGLVLDHLKNNRQEPFFLWVHLYDPHADYDPPPPFDTFSPSEPYAGEVAYMDYHIGRLVSYLKKTRLWYRTLSVFCADHGESLGSHGESTHGFLLHQPTLHVPLMIHLPRQTRGDEISRTVSLADVFPTVLKALDLAVPECDGRDLFSEGKAPVFSETFIPLSFNWSPLFSVRIGNRFYVGSPSEKLYDLATDPRESSPISEPDGRLETLVENYAGKNPGFTTTVHVDHETVERLRSLGYFLDGGEPSYKAWNRTRNPEDRMHLFRNYQAALALMEAGQDREADRIIGKVISEEPDNPRFHLLMARVTYRLGHFDRALQAAEQAAALDSGDVRSLFAAGFYAEKAGHLEKTRSYYDRALSIKPDHLLSRYNLSRLLIMTGELNRAEELLRGVLLDSPKYASAWNNLGFLLMEKSHDCAGALDAVRKAVGLNDTDPLYAVSLASVLLKCGNFSESRDMVEKARMLDPEGEYREEIKKITDGIRMHKKTPGGLGASGSGR